MRFKSKLHYTLKYLILAFPILITLGAMFAQSEQYFTLLNTFMEQIGGDMFFLAPWYFQMLQAIGFDFYELSLYGQFFIIIIPLWIFFVYFFDLVVDVMTFIPKFFHDLTHKEYK